MNEIKSIDLGLIAYKDAWNYQKKLFSQLWENKNSNLKNTNHYLLLCEHPHVFTIGKHGNSNNLLINDQMLKDKGIEYYHIDRGGDITYHGPGQQVVYPILDLDQFTINTREYVKRLEDAVINTLLEFDIVSGRLDGAAGIWLDADITERSRKICAIGIKSSQRITMHGIALNINTDLRFFGYMNPCGFSDKGVTSMQQELDRTINIDEVKQILKKNILNQFPS